MQALYIVISVVRAKVAALLIGAAGMGLADLYMRTMNLVGNATNFGLSLSAVKQLSPTFSAPSEDEASQTARRQVAQVRTWVMLTALLGAAACVVLSPLLSRWLTGSLSQTIRLACLAPAIAFTTLAGGETAILQSAHRLRALARATARGATATLAVSSAFYGLWGISGIVPMLIVSTAILLILLLRESHRLFAYQLCGIDHHFLKAGMPLLRLGSAYILAGVMASGVEMAIRAGLLRLSGGLATVGLYAAGFTLTVNYARLLFVGVDADYYPRLSTTIGHREANVAINRQINLLMVLMAPFLVVLALCLPLLVRLLYTNEFTCIIPMVICAAPSMFFKAIAMPIAYLPLARGHSLLYLGMELAYNILFGLLAVAGFWKGGLLGAGLALSAAHLADLVMVWSVYSQRYRYHMNRGTLFRLSALLILLLVGLAGAMMENLGWRIGSGLGVLLLMLPVVWPVLRKFRR